MNSHYKNQRIILLLLSSFYGFASLQAMVPRAARSLTHRAARLPYAIMMHSHVVKNCRGLKNHIYSRGLTNNANEQKLTSELHFNNSNNHHHENSKGNHHSNQTHYTNRYLPYTIAGVAPLLAFGDWWGKPSIDDKAKSELFEAIDKGNLDAVKKIIHKYKDALEVKDYRDRTPLLRAIYANNLDIAEFLINAGANVNAKDEYNNSALVFAIDKGYASLIELLIEKGARINGNGTPPLIRAAAKNDKKAVVILLEHGADLDACNSDNKTAIDVAREKNNKDLVLLLQEYKELQSMAALKPKEKLKDLAGPIPTEVLYLIEFGANKTIRDRYKLFNIEPYKGILLFGPTGAGKTALARAIAGELDAPFYVLKLSDIFSETWGTGEKRIRNIFKLAANAAKKNPSGMAIIFIDEIDAIASNRNQSRHEYNTVLLNCLLTEIDGFQPNSGVMVLAATNRIHVLDSAIIRPGRFDKKIKITAPDQEKQKDILKLYLAKIPYEHADNSAKQHELFQHIIHKFNEKNLYVSPAILKSIIDEAARHSAHTEKLATVSDTFILQAADEYIKNLHEQH